MAEKREVLELICHGYILVAFSSGELIYKPVPIIIKGSLSKIQVGIDRVRKAMSSANMVVTIHRERRLSFGWAPNQYQLGYSSAFHKSSRSRFSDEMLWLM